MVPAPEAVRAVVERITHRSEESDWTVMRVRMTEPHMNELQTVVGHTRAYPGQDIDAVGFWKIDPSWGRQFVADRIVATAPTGVEGIERYLASGMIRGIGPVAAKKIVATFGTDTIRVLDEESDRLVKVNGIGKKKCKAIQTGWAEQKTISAIMLFLNEQNIAPHLCKRIYKKYGEESIAVIRNDPFRLALEVPGIGFKSADTVAARLQIPRHSPQRIRAGIVYLMQDGAGKGHCGMRRQDLIVQAAEMLAINAGQVAAGLDFDLDIGGDALNDRSMLVQHDGVIYLSWLANSEEYIARQLALMAAQKPRWAIDGATAVKHAEAALGVTLAGQQREAVLMMLRSKVCVMTGGPGVGKTLTLKVLLHIFARHKVTVAVAAPTGKAAQQAAVVTGVAASTLHRLFGIKAGEKVDAKTAADVLVIDEFSMNDVPLTATVMRALSDHTA
ncbi:MAG: ATP-dependent RecD-like DNA helicase, partial [Rhodocyclaceae bacterium]